MAFTVTWRPAAEQQLTTIWIESRLRFSITAAVERVDELLRTDPMNAGESREGNRRVLFVDSLGVEFRVFELDRKVNVIAIWQPERRR